jgi:hypothetical protein
MRVNYRGAVYVVHTEADVWRLVGSLRALEGLRAAA